MESNTVIPSRKNRRKKQKKNVISRFIKRLIHIFVSILISISVITTILILFIRLGFIPVAQQFIVTSAMTTMSHKYLATIVASDSDIKEIMKNNSVEEPSTPQNPGLISQNSKSEKNDTIQLIKINQDRYQGYLLKILNPQKVFLGITSSLGTHGSKILDMAKQYNTIAGINASGFKDSGGHGKGDTPSGILISNGEIKYVQPKEKTFNIVGFNKDNILILGKYTLSQLQNLNLRDAVDFHPFLLVNGVPAKVNGNGGWGNGPRTAIGQTANGTVLLLVVDGRQLSSIGASMKQMQDIMIKYGAINAANLDGGSSTVMYYNNKIVNKPCSPYGDRYLPSAFLVKK